MSITKQEESKRQHIQDYKAIGGKAYITKNQDTNQAGVIVASLEGMVFIAWENLGYNDRDGYFDTSRYLRDNIFA